MQRLPVKTQCFAQFGISCELGNRKKWDERRMQHLPVKTQCDVALLVDYVICDVLLLFKRKAYLFLIRSCLMLFKLRNPLAGPRQTN